MSSRLTNRRTTIAPSSSSGTTSTTTSTTSALSMQRNRQYTHLAAQLAQLNANLADTENLLRMTSCQAEVVRGLGAWMGGLFMAASKVLGEEGVAASSSTANTVGEGVEGDATVFEGGAEGS